MPAAPHFQPAHLEPLCVRGIDGCRVGWVVAQITPEAVGKHRVELRIISRLADDPTLLACACIGIDMPIGLPSAAHPTPRRCERLAREMLGPTRRASIFSPPCREVLAAADYKAALATNRAVLGVGISKQSHNIVPKIAELDEWLAALPKADQGRVVEVHPELSFLQMVRQNSGDPQANPPPPKKTDAGKTARCGLLRSVGLGGISRTASSLSNQITTLRRGRASGVAADDVLDALAAAWSALRYARGEAVCLPVEPEHDERGLAMRMVV